jgi:hypothetical protein
MFFYTVASQVLNYTRSVAEYRHIWPKNSGLFCVMGSFRMCTVNQMALSSWKLRKQHKTGVTGKSQGGNYKCIQNFSLDNWKKQITWDTSSQREGQSCTYVIGILQEGMSRIQLARNRIQHGNARRGIFELSEQPSASQWQANQSPRSRPYSHEFTQSPLSALGPGSLETGQLSFDCQLTASSNGLCPSAGCPPRAVSGSGTSRWLSSLLAL